MLKSYITIVDKWVKKIVAVWVKNKNKTLDWRCYSGIMGNNACEMMGKIRQAREGCDKLAAVGLRNL